MARLLLPSELAILHGIHGEDLKKYDEIDLQFIQREHQECFAYG